MNGNSRPKAAVGSPAKTSTLTVPRTRGNGENPYAGRDQAEANRDAWWWSCAMQAVESMATTGRTFQMDDVTREFSLTDPDNPKRFGALMAAAHRLGIIEPVGVAESSRPTTARSLVRTWRGVR